MIVKVYVKLNLILIFFIYRSSSFTVPLPTQKLKSTPVLSSPSLHPPTSLSLSLPSLDLPPLLPLQFATAATTYCGLCYYDDRPRGDLTLELGKEVEVKKSTIKGAGLGLYALRDISKHTNLGVYPGVLSPTNTYRNTKLNTGKAVSYAWKLEDDRGVIGEEGGGGGEWRGEGGGQNKRK
jgi:hypothetical protein